MKSNKLTCIFLLLPQGIGEIVGIGNEVKGFKVGQGVMYMKFGAFEEYSVSLTEPIRCNFKCLEVQDKEHCFNQTQNSQTTIKNCTGSYFLFILSIRKQEKWVCRVHWKLHWLCLLCSQLMWGDDLCNCNLWLHYVGIWLIKCISFCSGNVTKTMHLQWILIMYIQLTQLLPPDNFWMQTSSG